MTRKISVPSSWPGPPLEVTMATPGGRRLERHTLGAGEEFVAEGLREIVDVTLELGDADPLDELALLAGQPIRTLKLGPVTLGSRRLKAVGLLPKLRSLSIDIRSGYTAGDLAYLSNQVQLVSFTVAAAGSAEVPLGDWNAQLAAFLKDQRLKALTLWDVKIGETAVVAIGRQEKLRHLEVHNVSFDAELQPLWTLGELRSLWFSFCDAELGDWLGRLSKLESLTLEYGAISAQAVQALPGLSHLRTLTLYHLGRAISRYELEALGKLQHVEQLSLTGSRLSWLQLRALRRRLPHCKISYNDGVGGTHLRDLDDPVSFYN